MENARLDALRPPGRLLTVSPGYARLGRRLTDNVAETGGDIMGRYSIAEAAALLGISERTLYRRIEKGRVKKEREGGRAWVIIEEGDLPRGRQVADGMADLGVFADLLREKDARITELEERGESLAAQLGRAVGRGEELEKQILLLTGPRPSLVERIRRALGI